MLSPEQVAEALSKCTNSDADLNLGDGESIWLPDATLNVVELTEELNRVLTEMYPVIPLLDSKVINE